MITPHGLNVGGDACIDGRERVSIVLIVGDTKNKRYVIRNRAILKQSHGVLILCPQHVSPLSQKASN